MGLFGFGKKEPVKPLEEYLAQRNEASLTKMAVHHVYGMYIWICSAAPEDKFLPIQVKFDIDVSKLIDCREFNIGTRLAEADPIPKCYRNDTVSAQRLLELACDKGAIHAPFYLAMMHEYGMVDGAKGMLIVGDELKKFRNQELADTYHQIALERDSAMEKAYRYQKEHWKWDEHPYDEQDNMIHLLTGVDNQDVIKDILGSFKKDYERFGGVLMAFYASKGFPKCMAAYTQYLASFVGFAGPISDTLEMTKSRMHMFESLYCDDRSRMSAAVGTMLERLISRAAHGCPREAFAVRQYKLNELLR